MGSNGAGTRNVDPLTREYRDLSRAFLLYTADGYFLHDIDGRILDVNAAACDGLGYTREELLALNVSDLELRFSGDELKKRWERLEPGRAYRFEAVHRRHNGSAMLVAGTSQRFELSSGPVIAALIHPVSGPEHLEAAGTRAEGDRAHSLQRAQILAQLGTWEWDGRRDQVVWDDTMCAMFGFTVEDYPRTLDGFLALLHPDSRGTVESALQKTFTERAPFDIDYKIIRPDGEIRSIHERGYISEVDGQGGVSAMYGIVQDITERRQLEEAIEHSEARFRMLVEQSPDAFYLHDLDGAILDVSPRTSEDLGYSREELLALNVADIEQAAGQDVLRQQWRSMVPGKHAIFAGINRRKDGSEFPVEVHSRRFEVDGEGRILALVRDFSGQQSLARLMEIILRSTARHSGGDFLQLLVRELAEVLDLKVAFVSRVLDQDISRLRIVAIWQGDSYGKAFTYDAAGTPCEQVFSDGLTVISGDVQTRFPQDTWLQENGIDSYAAIPFYDIAGNPLGHLGIMDNAPLEHAEVIEAALRVFGCHAAAQIERMQLQGALLNRERQLEILVAVNKRLNSDLNVQQIMRALVHAGQQLTGATAGAWGVLQKDELVFTEYQRGESVVTIDYGFRAGEGAPGQVLETGQPYISNDPRNDPQVIQEICEALGFSNLANVPITSKEGRLLGCFELHNKADGGFDAEDLNWCQALAADAAVALENAQLLAEVRASQRELELRVAERTAELAVANQELEAFSYSVSHDLRAPLRAIEGFSKVLLEEHSTGLDEDGRQYLARIVRASERMRELTEALLKLSRIVRSPLTVRRLDLSALASEVAEAVRSDQGERRVEIAIQPGVMVPGDAQLLRIALTNLIDNACKFTRQSDTPQIRFGSRTDHRETSYFVQDNGVGFDMEFAEHLFKPFQRMHADDAFEGLGIGLATVQRIIHRHGGRIWAEGVPGRGATFYFTLPG